MLMRVLSPEAEWLSNIVSSQHFRKLNTARQHLFKTAQGYFLQATTPCVVAYGYARICRLVRLGGGR
jgi:hypothetical protein